MPAALTTGFTSVDWDKVIEPNIAKFTAQVAIDALKKAVAGGFDSSPLLVTDGVPNRDYLQVRPFGRIEWVSRGNLAEIVAWMVEELERLSPVLTHTYQRSHIVMVNGAQFTGDLRTLPRDQPVQIVNTQPYAGKIEGRDPYTRWEIKRGKRSRKAQRRAKGWKPRQTAGESKMAPNGVYRVAINNLRARYGRSVVWQYMPVQLNLGVTVHSRAGGKSRRHVMKPQIYPCVTLSLIPPLLN